jgi:uncharacterized membrane protein YhiD involved in acid resistance
MGAIGAAIAFDRWEVAIVLAILNLITLEALVPVKKKLDEQQEAKSRLTL